MPLDEMLAYQNGYMADPIDWGNEHVEYKDIIETNVDGKGHVPSYVDVRIPIEFVPHLAGPGPEKVYRDNDEELEHTYQMVNIFAILYYSASFKH